MKERFLKFDDKKQAGGSVIKKSIESGKAMIDDNKETWNALIQEILDKNSYIITLRGAGSVNGADKLESDKLIDTELIPRIQELVKKGNVTVMYDGDPDDIEKPDIGYFMGRLADKFKGENKLSFVAAQKHSWYYPQEEGGNLGNANNEQYATYVFEDDKYPGDHNDFTQDKRLVTSDKYEQWYIGASGPIASEQLQDFNNKVPDGEKRSAHIFRVKHNESLDNEIQTKLNDSQGNDQMVAKFGKQLEQRKDVYGYHWNNEGRPIIKKSDFDKLKLSFTEVYK